MSARTAIAPQSLAGKRALVTGARGFLGRSLVPRLVAEGATVIAATRGPVDEMMAGNGVTWRLCDLSSAMTARLALSEISPDVVFHLAGCVTAAPDLRVAIPTFESLLASSVYLLEAATTYGRARVVIPCSLFQLGQLNDDAVPGSPYVAAKWAAVMYGRMFHALFGTPIVMPRVGIVFGPAQDDNKLIPHVISSLLRGHPPQVSNGALRADWIYINDVVEGLVATAVTSGIEGATLDIASGIAVSVREIVDGIVALTGTSITPSFGEAPDRPFEAYRVADLAATKSRLGWEPRTSLHDGLRQTLEWWRAGVPHPARVI